MRDVKTFSQRDVLWCHEGFFVLGVPNWKVYLQSWHAGVLRLPFWMVH